MTFFNISVSLVVFLCFCSGCASTHSERSVASGIPSPGESVELPHPFGADTNSGEPWVEDGRSLRRDFSALDRLIQVCGFQDGEFLMSRNSWEAVQYASIISTLAGTGISAGTKTPLRYNGMVRKVIPYRSLANQENGAQTVSAWNATRIIKLVRPQGFQHRNFLTSEYSFEGFLYARILRNIYGSRQETQGLLGTDFPMVYNSSVEESIGYLRSKESFMKRSLARAEEYLPLMTPIFRENDLPEDLAYLSLIESGFDPCAYSRAGACGPWQLMKGTAQRYGLRVDKWVDERRDPEKSTRAAVRYLKDLYGMFGDWYLAVAAYNAGEGKVAEAVRRYNSTDLWYLREKDYLKLETREFVPKLLAAITIGKKPEDHGFETLVPEAQVPLVKVHVSRSTDLGVLARMAGISPEELRRYNPELRSRCTPPSRGGYWIKIPSSKKETFAKNYSPKKKKFASEATLQEHRIKRGETLSEIARRYNTKVSHILKVNGMKKPEIIRPGQIILVPISPCAS